MAIPRGMGGERALSPNDPDRLLLPLRGPLPMDPEGLELGVWRDGGDEMYGAIEAEAEKGEGGEE